MYVLSDTAVGDRLIYIVWYNSKFMYICVDKIWGINNNNDPNIVIYIGFRLLINLDENYIYSPDS